MITIRWATMCLSLMTAFVVGDNVSAQESKLIDLTGRWIPAGTFVLSNLPNNSFREKSYRGASEERRRRIMTYLPGMTIVYNTVPSSLFPEKYVEGVNHAGLPIAVLESELSRGKFGERGTRDVVVHISHDACRNVECDGDMVPIGIGWSFAIAEENDEVIVLQSSDELRITYARGYFDDLERQGVLTRVKDRAHPRWEIIDGYAASLSTSCGEIISEGTEIEADEKIFDSNPKNWNENDPAWDVKAIQIFGLGDVQIDRQKGVYKGHISSAIHGQEEPNVAIDFSMFAYRDMGWKEKGHYKFAGLLQIVACRKTGMFGSNKPAHVKEALFYFDQKEGEGYEQRWPLVEYKLPRQFEDERVQEKLFTYLQRSFFYSINSPEEYARIFQKLSTERREQNGVPYAGIVYPTATAHLIARLNASCRLEERRNCRTMMVE